MNKKIIIISVILVLIAITFVVVLSLARNRLKKEIKQSGTATTTIQSPIPSMLTISGNIDTSDWETYRNEEFGFEFKHPSVVNGWTIYGSPDYKGNGMIVDSTAFDLSVNHFMSDGNISVYNKNIDDLLKDENYYMKKHWDIKIREKIILENRLESEKITWANNEIVFYIQKEGHPLTIEVTGYKNDLSDLFLPPTVTKEEQNTSFIMYNAILLKVISSLKFIGN